MCGLREIQVIPDFDGYTINLRTFEVFSIKTKKTIKPLSESKSWVYVLYQNGLPIRTSLFEILRKIILKTK